MKNRKLKIISILFISATLYWALAEKVCGQKKKDPYRERAQEIFDEMFHDAAKRKGLKDFSSEGMRAYEGARYEAAIQVWKAGLKEAEKQHHAAWKAFFLGSIGMAYDSVGRFEKALEYHEKALAIHRKIGDQRSESTDLSNMGIACMSMGRYNKALGYYEKSLAVTKKIGDLQGQAYAFGNMGIVYWYLNQYEKALKFQEESLSTSKRIGDTKGVGGALTNIGLVYDNLGLHEKALSYFKKVLVIHSKTGDMRGLGGALTNMSNAYWNLGEYVKAATLCEKATAIHRKTGNLPGEGITLGCIGEVYRKIGQNEKALPYFRKAVAIHRKIGDQREEANDLIFIGLVYQNARRYKKALAHYEKALAIHRRIGDAIGQGLCLNNIGSTMLALGNFSKAETHLTSAIDIYESIRARVKKGKERTGFQSTLPDVYGSLAATRLALKKIDGAFESVERGRAKTLLDLLGTRTVRRGKAGAKPVQIARMERQLIALREERLKLASAPAGAKTRSMGVLKQQISDLDRKRLELIEQLQRADPELGSLVVVDPPQIKKIQSLLSADTILVEYYHPGEKTINSKKSDQLWAFVLKKSGLHFKAIGVSRAALEKALENYARLLADGNSPLAVIQDISNKLYGWLIKPIDPLIQEETLIVVPWGPMLKIPFAALAPKGGKALGARKKVVAAPSAGVYRYLVKRRASAFRLVTAGPKGLERYRYLAKNQSPGSGRVYAVGNPKTAMAPLPGAEREAREIAGLFKDSIVKTGDQATESSIKNHYNTLGRPDVVHFACHGIFNEKAPELSHLALTPDKKNDGKLEMHELFSLDWKGVSLVTMSACSSGKGELGAGNDLIGLTRGFMFAGAPSVLCSLWDVDDEATRVLMVNFYKNYLSGMSKPESLHRAQIAMMKNPKWSHPYYWSAFVLFGDWM